MCVAHTAFIRTAYDSFICVAHDSFIRVGHDPLIYVPHASIICVVHFSIMCRVTLHVLGTSGAKKKASKDMTQSYVWHMTESYVSRDSMCSRYV